MSLVKINLANGWTLPNNMSQMTLNSFNGLELSNPHVLGYWRNGHSHMDCVSHTILFLITEATAEGTEQAQQTPEPKLYVLKKNSKQSPSLCNRYSNF
jgi:hypothetical protein